MVTNRYYQKEQMIPPPMDEAWWASVLAEDQALNPSVNKKNSRNNDNFKRVIKKKSINKNDCDSDNWENAYQYYEKDQVLECDVTGYNRGGLLVTGNGLQGFVPVSHLVSAPCKEEDEEVWLERYLERKIDLKVIECDQERGRIVLSERAAQAAPGSRKIILDKLSAGECAQGTVTNITDFGIFVDLGGVEGLIHVSEISWGRVQHPADVVSIGQSMNVFVIQVDQERARVALSLKRLTPNPWETAEERYYPGQITEATVTSIVPFGVFARVEEGLDGLIHISEVDRYDGNDDLKSTLKEGQSIRVRVLHVNADRQRLGLSLKLEDNGFS